MVDKVGECDILCVCSFTVYEEGERVIYCGCVGVLTVIFYKRKCDILHMCALTVILLAVLCTFTRFILY